MHFLTTIFTAILSISGPAVVVGGGQGAQVRPTTRGFDVERTIYGHSSKQLFRLELTGQGARTVPIGAFGAQITDIAMTDDGHLYGVSFSNFYSVDPQTGQTQLIGSMGVNDVNGLASVGNRLLASSTRGSFYYVNRGSGRATRAGAFGQGVVSSGDLSLGPGGVLYLTAPSGSRIGGPDRLMRVDPVTGAATQVGNTGLNAIYGLAFTGGQRNELIGLTESGVIARINPQTGAATQLATTSTPFWGGT